jgi:hypothetical protein
MIWSQLLRFGGLAAAAGGGGHFGGGMGGGHVGRIGGEHFGDDAEHRHFGEHRGWRATPGYYGDYESCRPPEESRPRRLRYFC